MTDKKILEEVYRRLKETTDNGFEVHNFTSVTSFIEQEWQRRDEEEYSDQYSTIGLENMADTTYSKHWYGDGCSSQHDSCDAQEIERHRGLEIGEDGTVKEIK